MAVQFKYSGKMGDRSPAITVDAGSDLTGEDGFEVGFDVTKMSARDACHALDQVKKKILEGNWPPL